MNWQDFSIGFSVGMAPKFKNIGGAKGLLH
jgi:hypothetical protein